MGVFCSSPFDGRPQGGGRLEPPARDSSGGCPVQLVRCWGHRSPVRVVCFLCLSFSPLIPPRRSQLAGNAQRQTCCHITSIHVKLEFGKIIFKQFNNCVILARRLNTSAADGTHTAAYSPHAHDIVRKDIPQVQLQACARDAAARLVRRNARLARAGATPRIGGSRATA